MRYKVWLSRKTPWNGRLSWGDWNGVGEADTKGQANAMGRAARTEELQRMRERNRWPGVKTSVRFKVTRNYQNNPAKRVVLKNFTGTITKNPNGTVSIKGRKK